MEKVFAGKDDQIKFIDGPKEYIQFFEPRRLEYKKRGDKEYLYVLDYNLVRRVEISGDRCVSSTTIAGKVTPEKMPVTQNGKACETMFAVSPLMDMAAVDEGILITDPKYAVVRLIKE
ncbi:MAG: hypothetical protein J1F64_11440 [Oscillospiraceae bacterium]|nr:hypothetical protein [Oscillospiraceae bacterium]